MVKPLALIALPLSLATPALAASDPTAERASVTVSYRDLDLATPAGTATLRHRIALAVTRVTGDADSRDAGVRQAVRHNRAVAMAGAEAQMQIALAQTNVHYAAAAPSTTAAPGF